jgi:hypothetical protein
MPADKFDWRPGPGVRSVGEVYIHIAETNVLLLGFLGVRVDFPGPRFSGKDSAGVVIARNLEFEKTVRGKDNIVALLERTLDAVTTSLASADMEKPVEMFGRMTTARAVYLRILAHANEHMGQSVAYARIVINRFHRIVGQAFRIVDVAAGSWVLCADFLSRCARFGKAVEDRDGVAG